MTNTEKVELHPAYIWTCDNCGRDNFERCVTFEPHEEQLDELLQATGMTREEYEEWTADPSRGGVFTTSPSAVRCQHCQTAYEVENPTEPF